MIKIKGSIGRGSDGIVRVEITDELSGIRFLECKFDIKSFAEMLLGLSYVEGSAEVRGLQYVGMQCIRENRTIFCPLTTHDEKELAEWLKENSKEDGWLLNTYLGSQGSIVHVDGGKQLNYSVIKYVEAENA